jgi:hypothetical protein
VAEVFTQTFNGDKNSIAIECFNGDCYEWIVEDLIGVPDWGCNDGMIHTCACLPGGYGPYGPDQYIDTYGEHEIPVWDKSGGNCEDGEDFKMVVTSVPTVIAEITRKDE